MRAVTIRQPRAGAMFAGPGPFPLPCWWTSHRGPLLIHAAKRVSGDAAADPAGPPAFGVLLGVVELADCVETGKADEAGFVWVLTNPRAFARAVPHPGRGIGLFKVPDAVVASALAEGPRPNARKRM